MMMFGTVVETYSENHMLLHQGMTYRAPSQIGIMSLIKSYTTPKKNRHRTPVLRTKFKGSLSSDFVRARGERTF